MSQAQAASSGERDDRPLATYFDSLQRETAERGSFTPGEAADITRRDRDDAPR